MPHDYEQKYKNEEFFENMGFIVKTVWRFQTKKKIRKTFSLDQSTHTRPLNPSIE